MEDFWSPLQASIEEICQDFRSYSNNRFLQRLLFSVVDVECGFVSNVLKSISRVRQKIRPGRHSPRQSRKPINK